MDGVDLSIDDGEFFALLGPNVIKPVGSYPAYFSGAAGSSNLTSAQFDKILANLQDDAKKGPSGNEALIPAKQGIFSGGRSINSIADINSYKNNYIANNLPAYEEPAGTMSRKFWLWKPTATLLQRRAVDRKSVV